MNARINLLFLAIFSFLLASCNKMAINSENNYSFAIFSVEDDIYGSSNVQLEKLILSEKPLLSSNDIECYIWNKHQISYSDTVYYRFKTTNDLWRKGFVVTLDGKRIYWGLFQSSLDSYASQNPVIMLVPGFHILPPILQISCNYFNIDCQEGEADPRSDQRIYDALISEALICE